MADWSEKTIKVRRRCLVVSATFQAQGLSSGTSEGSMMAAPPTSLRYGDQKSYITGVQDITHNPPSQCKRSCASHGVARLEGSLLQPDGMRGVCKRPHEKEVALHTRHPGANNDGKTWQQFWDQVNTHIRQRRRAAGHRGDLPEAYALLTNEEVLTVRLYSGSAYHPLNNFSASRHKCKGRTAMLSENILL